MLKYIVEYIYFLPEINIVYNSNMVHLLTRFNFWWTKVQMQFRAQFLYLLSFNSWK